MLDINEFGARLNVGRGLFALECDGSYRQYVAYLAALNAQCPVFLCRNRDDWVSSGYGLTYGYNPKTDQLEVLLARDAGPELHPDLCVLLSTSGSTGSAKSVRLSQRNVSSNAEAIAQYLELTKKDKAPMALPFQYSYGMSVFNSHMEAGASVYLTDHSVIDSAFWADFRDVGCTSFAGVPHSFELMQQNNIDTASLSSLKYMTQAGGRLAPEKVAYWANRSKEEDWLFYVMYGQTEAAPRISYLPPDRATSNPQCIGVAIPGGELKVVGPDGAQLPDGAPGELVYRGPNTMMGYAVKDADLAEDAGSDVLETGDIAIRHHDGLFEIVGRKNRFVKAFGLRISLDEVEKQFSKDGIDVVCGAQKERMYVLVAKAPSTSPPDLTQLSNEIAAWLGVPQSAFEVHEISAIPRADSGKVDGRGVAKIVAAIAENGENAEASATPNFAERFKGVVARRLGFRKKTSVSAVLQQHFPSQEVGPDTTFETLGGDSLTFLSVAIDLEGILGELPADWPSLSVNELENTAPKLGFMTKIDVPTLLRAIAISLIVASHLQLFEYGGTGARTLFFVAGWSLAVFTLPAIVSSNSTMPLWRLIWRVASLTLFFVLLNQLVIGYGEWPSMLLIANWFGPDVAGGVWFIEVYLQILVFFGLLFSIPPVRKALARDSFLAAVALCGVAIAVMAISEAYFDFHHLFRRLPHLFAWVVLCGAVAALAKSTWQKAVATLMVAAGTQLMFGVAIKLFLFAVLAAIWIPAIPLPRPLIVIVRNVANASLVIYLTHFNFASIARKLGVDSPAFSVALALIGGVLIWWMIELLAELFQIRPRASGAKEQQAGNSANI